MVKRGTKRKIEMKKITNKYSLATSFTKRSYGLYSKASQLCLLTDAQIAILATPSSSNSNVSFFSFGHSSVEAVVSAYLSGESLAPLSIMETKEMKEDLGVCMARSDLGLGHWWDNDERFKTPEETMEAIESIKSLLSQVRALRSHPNQNPNRREASLVVDDDSKNNKSDVVLNHHGTDETLVNLRDIPEHDQILSISDRLCNNNDLSAGHEWSDMDIDDENQSTEEEEEEEEEENNQISENLCSDNNALLPESQTQEEDDHQIVSISENSCRDNKDLSAGNVCEWSNMDLDQLLTDIDDKNQTTEEEEDQISENLCSDNNALLPENQTEEEDDHQIVSISENSCSDNNAPLLPEAGNLKETDLDFETNFEGLLPDEELDEFARRLLTS